MPGPDKTCRAARVALSLPIPVSTTRSSRCDERRSHVGEGSPASLRGLPSCFNRGRDSCGKAASTTTRITATTAQERPAGAGRSRSSPLASATHPLGHALYARRTLKAMRPRSGGCATAKRRHPTDEVDCIRLRRQEHGDPLAVECSHVHRPGQKRGSRVHRTREKHEAATRSCARARQEGVEGAADAAHPARGRRKRTGVPTPVLQHPHGEDLARVAFLESRAK